MGYSQRIYTRVPHPQRVYIAESEYITDDLSLGGLRIRDISVSCSTGDLLKCELHLPSNSGSSLVTLEAEVRRFIPMQNELAARFVNIPEREFEILARHIEKMTSDALQASENAKATFLATISHEINTPLNAVLGFSEIGQANATDLTEVRSYFESIHDAGERLHQFLTNSMDLASLDQLAVARECRPSLLKEIISPIITHLLPMANKKEIKLTDISIGDDAVMFIARKHAIRALFELGQNAVKYTPPGGEINFESSYRNDGMFDITVRDTGIGIPDDKIEAIFGSFSKGENDYFVTGDSGPGLGLAIAQKLAKLMGGDVSATSVEGIGSRLTLSLPMVHGIRL